VSPLDPLAKAAAALKLSFFFTPVSTSFYISLLNMYEIELLINFC